MPFQSTDPGFEQRTRESFARQGIMAHLGAKLEAVAPVGEVIRAGRTLTVCRLEAFVDNAGKRVHCATGLQTLMSLVGRAGVRD